MRHHDQSCDRASHWTSVAFVCKIPLLARRTQPVSQARRATIGYLIYKCCFRLHSYWLFRGMDSLSASCIIELGVASVTVSSRVIYLYARYLCSRDALSLKARPSARAMIGYLIYKSFICLSCARRLSCVCFLTVRQVSHCCLSRERHQTVCRACFAMLDVTRRASSGWPCRTTSCVLQDCIDI